ncbi:hypothetical protein C0J52_18324 [Blattella germanica]|nr:hypothetical protein C0J52_18324 [Blattella germanica]
MGTHRNVRLFVSQCGLQSFQEAVFHAVPVLGIPFIAHQKFNAKKIQDSGIGVKLSFVDVTKESLTQTINKILHNLRYKENMDKFSALSKDEARSSLEKIVWWTEYVLRHNGTKHLRSAALDLAWYQYLLLDVIFETPIQNYTDIDISFSYGEFHSAFDFTSMEQISVYELASLSIPKMAKLTEDQLSSPQIQEFIRSTNNSKFDLVFLEVHINQAFFGLVHKLGSPPLIGILSMGNLWAVPDFFGSSTNPSFITDCLLPYSSHMRFFERLQNTIFWLWIRYQLYGHVFPTHEKIMRKHFGEETPSIHEAYDKMDLMMIGTSWVYNYPIPVVPQIINFHGLHIKTSNDLLPKDLQTFLDDAKDGVIYLSLGTNVFSDQLPEEKRHAFISAFSELPQRIVWKWESDYLPGKPENVKISKWLPQQDVLAHPNVRLFISQCGVQSFQEAVFYAVPILGIPFIVDQKYNTKKIEESGVGLAISLQNVTKESLLYAINEILNNPRFEENMKVMSSISKDEPKSSLECAVWWTEYVLCHKGAKHLRSAALNLKWYQYLLLDVVSLILFIAVIIISLLYFCIRLIFIHLFIGRAQKSKYE